MRIKEGLARTAERSKQFFFGILKPAEEVWKPDNAGGVGVGPMHFLANLKEARHVSQYKGNTKITKNSLF